MTVWEQVYKCLCICLIHIYINAFVCIVGAISCSELYSFFELLLEEAKEKLYDLQHVVFLALSTSPNKRYIPPAVGKVSVVVTMSHNREQTSNTLHEHSVALTESQIIRASNVAKHSIHFGTMLKYIIGMVNVRFGEAVTLLHDISMESGDVISLLAAMLPTISSTKDVVRLINVFCGSDDAKMEQLEKKLGVPALRVLMGKFDGYYSLNLSKQGDRVCLSRLLCLSESVYERRKSSGMGDLSQLGNHSCFRNTRVVDAKLVASAEEDGRWSKNVFSPMPRQGKLEFDFSSAIVPDPTTCSVCSDSTILGFLDYVGMLDAPVTKAPESASKKKRKKPKPKPAVISAHERTAVRSQWASEQLRLMRKRCSGPAAGHTHGVPSTFWSVDYGRAASVASHLREDFYPNLEKRSEQYAVSQILPKPLCGRTIGKSQFSGSIEESLAKYDRGFMSGIRSSNTKLLHSRKEDNANGGNPGEPAVLANDSDSKNVKNALNVVASEEPKTDDTVDETVPVATTVMDARDEVSAFAGDKDNHGEDVELRELSSCEEDDNFDIDAQIAECLAADEDHDRFAKIPRFSSLDISTKRAELQKCSEQRNLALLEQQKRNITCSNKPGFPVQLGTAAVARMLSLESLCQRFFSANRCLRSRHVAVILALYDNGRMNETQYFGSYRVDILVSLFSKIVDVHNIELVLSVLSPQEHACFIARIGWLSVFNPWKVDHVWELNLERAEEACVFKMLMHIHMAENGELCKYHICMCVF